MTSVLILTPSVSPAGGGVSEAVRLIGRLFAEDDAVQIRVLALRDTAEPSAGEGWAGIPVETFRSFGPARFGFSPGLLLAAIRSRADVIHVHGIWQFHCLAAFAAAVLGGKRYLVTPHGMMEAWIRARSRKLKALVSGLYQDRFLKRATTFQILTEKEREDVRDMVPDAHCVLVPNYVEPHFPDDGPPPWWNAALDGRRIIMFFGRIHEKKGCLELCEAWERLSERQPELVHRIALVFCGKIDGIVGLEQTVDELHAQFGNVIFAGPQYGIDKQRSLARASFLCLPSRSEGLPLAILEGWAAGVPAIMTTECNLDAGFAAGAALRTTVEPEEIARALLAATAMSDDERSRMANAGRELVEREFSASAVRTKLSALYRNVASGRSS